MKMYVRYDRLHEATDARNKVGLPPLFDRTASFSKYILSGTVAASCLVTSARAGDLPTGKAPPAEYVRTCPAHGVGFFQIPGADTCIRIGGRARFDYQFYSAPQMGVDRSNFRGSGRLSVDARTYTDWGTLRTFIRYDINSASGSDIATPPLLRYAYAFTATGIDTYGRQQKQVDADKAFVQFAGLTAGRAASFYDFYAGDIELIGLPIASSRSSTTLAAYTAQFGSGLSASLSVEDPILRRNPLFNTGGVYANQAPGSLLPTGITNNPSSGVTFVSPVTLYGAAGIAGQAYIDVVQRSQLPDFIANLRVDQGWGSAQLSGVVHQLSIGQYISTTVPGATTTAAGGIAPATTGTYAGFANTSGYTTANGLQGRRPDAQYGYGVQAGVKLNLPFLSPGDTLWLQAAYARGAMAYTGNDIPIGPEGVGKALPGGRLVVTGVDGYVDAFGSLKLTTSTSLNVILLHYWAPQWRSGFMFSYGWVDIPNSARISGPLGNITALAGGTPLTATNNPLYNVTLKSYEQFVTGANLVWSPVKDVDIGAEVLYQRLDPDGRVYDTSRTGTGKTVSYDSNWITRLRVERAF